MKQRWQTIFLFCVFLLITTHFYASTLHSVALCLSVCLKVFYQSIHVDRQYHNVAGATSDGMSVGKITLR